MERRGALKSGMGASHPLGVYRAPEGPEVPGGRGVVESTPEPCSRVVLLF